MPLLSRNKQLRHPSTSKNTAGKKQCLGISSRRLRNAVEKLDATLEKANRLTQDLKRAGKALEENVSLSSALAWPALALTSVYQAELMKMVGAKKSDHIQGIHYAEPADVIPHALALLRKQVDSAGSEGGALYRCLTNAIYVLENGTFIDLSRLLYLLITACSLGPDLKNRDAEYKRFMLHVELTVEDYHQKERPGIESSSIVQVEDLRKKVKEFLNNDETIRSLNETVAGGIKGAEQLKKILGKIDSHTRDMKFRQVTADTSGAGISARTRMNPAEGKKDLHPDSGLSRHGAIRRGRN